MTRQEILNQAKQILGLVPEWLDGMPDAALQQFVDSLTWFRSETKLSGRDKALVAFGAASALHCPY